MVEMTHGDLITPNTTANGGLLNLLVATCRLVPVSLALKHLAVCNIEQSNDKNTIFVMCLTDSATKFIAIGKIILN